MAYPTNPIYKLVKDPFTNQVVSVSTQIAPNHAKCIPFNEKNTDYQKYLEWVAEGNTPEAAD